MSNDNGSTRRPAGNSAKGRAKASAGKSVVARNGSRSPEALEPGRSTSLERAHELRAALGVRQQAEALVTEASQLRQLAAADAESMVAEAESMAGELVAEAREQAELLLRDAQHHADEMVGRARAESDRLHTDADAERARMREEVAAEARAELAAEWARVEAVLADVRDALRVLAPTLTGAGATLVDVLGTLDGLRAGDTGEAAAGEAAAGEAAAGEAGTGAADGVVHVPAGPQEVAAGEHPGAAPPAPRDGNAPLDAPLDGTGDGTDDARPLGWLFRNGQG
ncbi:hypothetical protein [Nocardioides sp.]|uniref:hypothetical protein n=1 Tax=Nocardioides sp. TaxID=35761 RepID=UPI0037839FD0